MLKGLLNQGGNGKIAPNKTSGTGHQNKYTGSGAPPRPIKPSGPSTSMNPVEKITTGSNQVDIQVE